MIWQNNKTYCNVLYLDITVRKKKNEKIQLHDSIKEIYKRNM